MCATFLAKSAFGRVGENITQNIRIDLYTEILRNVQNDEINRRILKN